MIDGELSERESLTLSNDDYSVNDNTVTYEHPALSGESRYYTLTAVKNGIPDSKQYGNLCQTLGTARPVMDEPDYSTITIQWPSVQKADSDYVITAYYADDSSKTSIIDEENTSLSEEEGIVTCTITNPEGYDDWKVSGKAINFSVTAKNTDTGDQTSSGNIEVRTLGPALVGTEAEKDSIQETRLIVRWNKIDGAKGYIIYRTKYMYDDEWTKWEFTKADTYYYNTTTDEILANGETASSSQVKIALSDNTYTLTDYYCAQTDSTSTYQTNQAQINWGIPYGYVILPVKGNKDDFNFGSDEEYLTITGGNSNIIYTSALKDEITATTGFGLNIAAQKAENTKTQKIEWYEPYFGSNYKPYLYYRVADSSSVWTSMPEVIMSKGDKSVSFIPNDPYTAYEYAIVYNKSTSLLSLTPSYSELLEETNENRYTYDSSVNMEQLNKGYLLAIPFNAKYGGTINNNSYDKTDGKYYSEYIYWDSWNYDERSIGPESAGIYIYNANLSACKNNTWVKVSTTDSYCKTSSTENLENTAIDSDDNSLSIKPVLIAGNDTDSSGNTLYVTPGPLQVLRDAKHYYKISFNGKEGSSEELSIGNDKSIFAYRQISDLELIRSAIITLNTGMYKIGKLDFETESYAGDNSGTISATHQSTMNIGKEYKFAAINYAPNTESPSGDSVCSFVITSEFSAYRNLGTQGGYTKSIDSTSISVAPYSNSSDYNVNTLETYTGTISFTLGSNESASISCNDYSISITDATTRRFYIPFIMYGDENWYHENSSYDWWN